MAKWRLIDELFHAAAERAPHERAAFLDKACGGDEELCRKIESLLVADMASQPRSALSYAPVHIVGLMF